MNIAMMLRWLEREFDYVMPTADDNDVRICCPFCYDRAGKTDTNYHMYISKNMQAVHCFRCGWATRNYEAFIRVYLKVFDVDDIIKELVVAEDFVSIADRLEEVVEEEVMIEEHHIPLWFKKLSDYEPFSSQSQKAFNHRMIVAYALKRLTLEDIKNYNLGFLDISLAEDEEVKQYGYRLILPIERGFIQGRTIFDQVRPRYLNSTFEIGDRLFNAPALDMYDHVYICEGAISAIALGANAIATLSMNINPQQIDRICNSYAKAFTFAFDFGTTLNNSMLRLATLLMDSGKHVGIRQYFDGDPASSTNYAIHDYGLKYIVAMKLDNL